jgi:hypothetical protein
MPKSREAELLAKHLAELQVRDERLAKLEKQNAALEEKNAILEQENALLRQKIDLLVRKVFGAQSEKLDSAQLLLLLQGTDQPGKAPEPVAAEAPRRSPAPSPPRERKPRLPEHLPVLEEVIIPEPVQAAPQDWRRIGEEVSERLDYEPGRFLRRRTVRPKYVPRSNAKTPCRSLHRCRCSHDATRLKEAILRVPGLFPLWIIDSVLLLWERGFGRPGSILRFLVFASELIKNSATSSRRFEQCPSKRI